VSALFSGLAFVGVVAAIFLQWKELGYQREELRQTKEAMQSSSLAQQGQTTELQVQTELLKKQVLEQSQAQGRQSREQFLTARLNVSLARAQLLQAKAQLPPPSQAATYPRAVRSLEQDIAILNCEAKLGFDAKPWTAAVERRAIHRYLVDMFQDMWDASQADVGWQLNCVDVSENAKAALSLLAVRTLSQHPDISVVLSTMLQSVPRHPSQPDGSKDFPRDTARWLQSQLASALLESNRPWNVPTQPVHQSTAPPSDTVADVRNSPA
jgi:hypothetical protein